MTELVVFAKHWQPGQVKTRLAATTGELCAANIYHAFVNCILSRLESSGDQRNVCISPITRQREFRQLIGKRDWQITQQVSGNLGQRMAKMFEDRLNQPAVSQVVLIGSDSPDLPIAIIEQAIDALHHNDVVLGPTGDGGYYLIGMSTQTPDLFVNMPWSTPQLWNRTIATLEAANRSYEQLPFWSDVDDYRDLVALRNSLDANLDQDPSLMTLREKLTEFLDTP